jgi:hypothetical protein
LYAGEIKLKVEARLGELIIAEQEAGRLAKQGQPKKGNNAVTLISVGLSKMDSQRAQMVANNKELISAVVEAATSDLRKERTVFFLLRPYLIVVVKVWGPLMYVVDCSMHHGEAAAPSIYVSNVTEIIP